MRRIESSTRSTLWFSEERGFVREYHDTGRLDEPRLPFLDARGVPRYSGNRRVDTLLEEASFRGSDTSRPAYLRRALHHLVREPANVRDYARFCNVEITTAWSYACKVVELWPDSRVYAKRLVHPGLFEALVEVDRCGSLREVMQRLNEGPLRGDTAWRCVDDRYAHLRLARLCDDR